MLFVHHKKGFGAFIAVLTVAMLLFSCGGDVGGLNETAGGITIEADVTTLPADGASSATIKATVLDSSGQGVPLGTVVTFKTNLGRFLNGTQEHSVTVGSTSGVVTAVLVAGTTNGVANVQVNANGATQSINIIIGISGGAITLTAEPTTIPADGKSVSKLTAVLTDSTGNPVPVGTSAVFTTTLGTFNNNSQQLTAATADDTGTIVVSLIASNTPGVAHVQVSAMGTSISVDIGIGASTGSVNLSAAPTSIPTNSYATITATLTDYAGKAAANVTTTFTTTLGTMADEATGEPTLGAISKPSDANGVAQVFLYSGTVQGTAVVTCTAMGNTAKVSVRFTGAVASVSAVQTTGSSSSETQDSGSVSLAISGFNDSVVDTITLKNQEQTVGSVVLNKGTPLVDDGNADIVNWPISTLVIGANGEPLKNTELSVNLTPVQYFTGQTIRDSSTGTCEQYVSETCPWDGQSTIASAAGIESLRVTQEKIVTDESGLAQINLSYPKSLAGWVKVSLGASSQIGAVAGEGMLTMIPPGLGSSDCRQATSPFGLNGCSD
jgi:hypothetical protein